MTHKHEWVIRGAGFRCKDFPECGTQLSNADVENRLNATEELPLELAKKWAYYRNTKEDFITSLRIALRAYAERMEDDAQT